MIDILLKKTAKDIGDIFETKALGVCKVIEVCISASMCLIKKDVDGYYNIMPVMNNYLTRFGKYTGNNKITLEQLFEVQDENNN